MLLTLTLPLIGRSPALSWVLFNSFIAFYSAGQGDGRIYSSIH
jgi:hypothetical protein